MPGLETCIFYLSYSMIYCVSLKILLVIIILCNWSRYGKISRIHKRSWSTLKWNRMDYTCMISACLRGLLLVEIAMMRSSPTTMRYSFCLLAFLIVIYKNTSLSCCQLTGILKLIPIVGSSRCRNHLQWLLI